jgi:hypothetical protein
MLAVGVGSPAMAARAVTNASKTVNGADITSWSVTGDKGAIQEVGVTVPMSVIKNPPPSPGMGPDGAVAVLPFSAEVQKDTYFNHFEMHWNPKGHPPAVFETPHFDLHFYAVPESAVMSIASMDAEPPAPEYLPAGYVYPGKDTFEMQMGVHTLNPAGLKPPFNAVMIAGSDKGRMHFVEPMVTRAMLLAKKDVKLDMPRPARFGRSMLYPTKFEGKYDRKADAYRFVFSHFVPVQ